MLRWPLQSHGFSSSAVWCPPKSEITCLKVA